ncbi:MAG: hypothetical protein ACRDD1_22570, partial [Planctomycetia bacterium]
MTRRGNNGESGLSLFPFLAVMVSTMGALILLLLVVAKRAQTSAEVEHLTGRDAAPYRSPLQKDPPLPDLVDWPAPESLPEENLPTLVERPMAPLPVPVDRRPDLSAAKKTLDDRLAAAEATARAATAKAAAVAAAAEKIRRTPSSKPAKPIDETEEKDAAERAALDANLAVLERQLDAVRRLTERQRKAAEDLEPDADGLERDVEATRKAVAKKGQGNRYAIVPYAGVNGTRRRPLYIECLPDAIVLQPEGVVLKADDLGDPDDPANALTAALRAQIIGLTPRGVDGRPNRAEEPYPLLIVRPDGISAYYAARSALEHIRTTFGYELVGEDVELAYNMPDPVAKSLAVQAIAKVQERRRLLALRNSGGGGRGDGFGPGTGGFSRGGSGDGDGVDGFGQGRGRAGGALSEPSVGTGGNRGDVAGNGGTDGRNGGGRFNRGGPGGDGTGNGFGA